MTDESQLDEVFDTMRDDIPAPQRIASAKADFLQQARQLRESKSVTPPDSMRHNRWRPLFRRHSGQATTRGDTTVTKQRQWSTWAAVIAVILITAGAVFGQDIIDFFIPSEDDTRETVVYPANPRDEEAMDDEQPQRLTIEEVIAQADFTVRLPEFMPRVYSFAGATYDAERRSVWMNYTCGSYGVGIYQQVMTLEEAEAAIIEVGPDAQIIDVPVAGTIGQYVRGFWFVSDYDTSAEFDESGGIPAEAEWVENSDFQRLIWYTDGVIYTIQTSAGRATVDDHMPANECLLDIDDYAAIANSMYPELEGTAEPES